MKQVTSRAALNKVTNRLFDGLALVITAFLIGLIVYPLGTMLIRVFVVDGVFRVDYIGELFQNDTLGVSIVNTIIVVVASSSIALFVGSFFAWLSERTDASLGKLGAVLPLVPLLMPPIAMSVGWMFLASERAGIINVILRSFLSGFGYTDTKGPIAIESWPGLVFVYTIYLVPLVFVTVASAFRSLDPAMEEASRTSGAGLFRTARLVAIPSLLPALGGALVLVVVFSASVFSIPSIIGTAAQIRVVSVEIVRLMLRFPPAIAEAVSLGIVISIVVGVLWAMQRRSAGRGRHATVGARPGGGALVKLGLWRGPAKAVMVTYLVIASVLPLAALAMVGLQPFWSPAIDWSTLSLKNFQALVAESSLARQSIINSVTLSLIGATVGMVLVTVLTVYARERARGQAWIVDTATKLPAGIPHVVVGMAFIITFSGPPFGLYGSALMIVLAYIMLYLPQASIAAGTAYDQVGGAVMEASRVAGADRMRTLWRITAPLMLPGLVAGWTLLFVLMVGELNTSVILASPANPVVGFVFLNIWENGTFSQLAALGTVISLISATFVTLVLLRSRSTAGALGGPRG